MDVIELDHAVERQVRANALLAGKVRGRRGQRSVSRLLGSPAPDDIDV